MSPLRDLEQALHPWIAYGVLPIFAFANAGVPLTGMTLSALLETIPLGIALGLFFGKQIGVFVFSWISIKLGIARLPSGANWGQLYGIAILCGIGFTMSLFIGSLAFTNQGIKYGALLRIGVLAGSLISGTVGYIVLRMFSRLPRKKVNVHN